MRFALIISLALVSGSAVAQDSCGQAALEAQLKPMIASGTPSGTAFRAEVEDGTDPTAALIKVAPEGERPKLESCRVAIEGVLEDLGFPPLH